MKTKNKIKWDTDLEFVDRRFLNKGNHHSTACVVGKITGEDFSNYPFCEFYMSDCQRTIALSMDSYNVEQLENSIFKLEQIIKGASKMKEAMRKLKPLLKKIEKIEKEEEAAKLKESDS